MTVNDLSMAISFTITKKTFKKAWQLRTNKSPTTAHNIVPKILLGTFLLNFIHFNP